MFRTITFLLSTFVFCSGADQELQTFHGSCDSTIAQPIPDFNIHAASGKWYVLNTFELMGSFKGDCEVRQQIGTKLYSTVTNISTGISTTTPMHLSYYDTDVHDGVIKVAFTDGLTTKTNVLGTDYTHYLVLWTCQDNKDNTHIEYLTVAGTSVVFPPFIRDTVRDTLVNNGIDISKIVSVYHGPKCNDINAISDVDDHKLQHRRPHGMRPFWRPGGGLTDFWEGRGRGQEEKERK